MKESISEREGRSATCRIRPVDDSRLLFVKWLFPRWSMNLRARYTSGLMEQILAFSWGSDLHQSVSSTCYIKQLAIKYTWYICSLRMGMQGPFRSQKCIYNFQVTIICEKWFCQNLQSACKLCSQTGFGETGPGALLSSFGHLSSSLSYLFGNGSEC